MPIRIQLTSRWGLRAYVAPTNGLRMFPWRILHIGPIEIQIRPRIL
jgi:hypothetical protein